MPEAWGRIPEELDHASCIRNPVLSFFFIALPPYGNILS